MQGFWTRILRGGLRAGLKVAAGILSASVILAGCGSDQAPQTQGPLILTDNPGVILAAQAYNALGQDPPIRIEIAEAADGGLVPHMRTMSPRPDGIISNQHLYPQSLSLFASVNSLITSLNRSPADYPPRALVMDPEAQSYVALPLSVTLPIVVYRKNDPSMAGRRRITLEELAALAREYNTLEDNRLIRAGFLPTTNPAFLYAAAQIFKVDFKASVLEHRLSWNPSAFTAFTEFLRGWFDPEEVALEQQRRFEQELAYDPWHIMVSDGRLRFTLTSFQEYYSIPSVLRQNLAYAWFTGGQNHPGIPLYSQPVSASILKTSTNQDRTLDFFTWLSSPEGIQALYDLWIDQQMPGLSFLGGFPVTPMGQTTWASTYFPGLENPVPGLDELVFSEILPSQWKKMKQEVILPQIIANIRAPENTSDSQDTLIQELERWQRLYRQE